MPGGVTAVKKPNAHIIRENALLSAISHHIESSHLFRIFKGGGWKGGGMFFLAKTILTGMHAGPSFPLHSLGIILKKKIP